MKRMRWLGLLVLLAGCCFGQAGLKYSITVTKFENKANWSGRWALGDA